MPTLHVEVTLSVDDLVKAAQRLDDDDFERFLVAIQWVASRRKAARAAPPPVLEQNATERPPARESED